MRTRHLIIGFTERLRKVSERRLHSDAVPLNPYWASRYFTDGVHLFRFVCWINDSVGAAVAAFEDCKSLEIMLLRADEINASGLSPL